MANYFPDSLTTPPRKLYFASSNVCLLQSHKFRHHLQKMTGRIKLWRPKKQRTSFFQIFLLTVHPNIMTVFFFTNLIQKFFILIHLLHSSTCFEHYCAHPQEDICIGTASGIVTVETSEWFILHYMFRALLCSSSGGHLYWYSIWYSHCGNKWVVYTPLHVSSTTVLIFRRTFVLVQHLVSSLWKQVWPLTCFHSDYTRCCTNTIVLLKISTVVLETCTGV